jgi:prolipoprotein diacylglyceryltransferase
MISYGIGRVGCQVAGDGDWGIVNNRPNPYSWLPDWVWSYTYPHNVINAGVPIPGCEGNYCNELPLPVYPTAFYETVACFLLFVLLWSLRKKITVPGRLFGLYLAVNGVERFFIEKIRVNTKYNIFGFQPTQAEIISSLLVITGIIIWFWARKYQLAHPSRLRS